MKIWMWSLLVGGEVGFLLLLVQDCAREIDLKDFCPDHFKCTQKYNASFLWEKLDTYIIVGIVRTLYYKLNNVAFKLWKGLEIEEIISTVDVYSFSYQKKTSSKNTSFAYYIFYPHLFMSAQDIFSICSLAKALRKN